MKKEMTERELKKKLKERKNQKLERLRREIQALYGEDSVRVRKPYKFASTTCMCGQIMFMGVVSPDLKDTLNSNYQKTKRTLRNKWETLIRIRKRIKITLGKKKTTVRKALEKMKATLEKTMTALETLKKIKMRWSRSRSERKITRLENGGAARHEEDDEEDCAEYYSADSVSKEENITEEDPW